MATKKINITPLGVIEGVSAKTGKDYKFYRYLLPSGKVATSSTELKKGDTVVLSETKDGYFNLAAATGAAFEVELQGGE